MFATKFKKFIRFVSTLFASREFAILYCVIGTVAEIAHMYYLTYSISALTGWMKTIQAILLSTFISSSLLYFVLISDDRDTSERGKKDSKRINLAINIFTFINIAINFYYYCRHLIIDAAQWQIFDFIFAILVSCLLPITIKLYANSIHVRDWDEFNYDKKSENINWEEYKPQIIEIISDEYKKLKSNDLDLGNLLTDIKGEIKNVVIDELNQLQLPNKEQIKEAFHEQSELFLKQFENRCNLIIRQKETIGKELPENINIEN
jgi:hypothetical protein